jgi:hypothetical protein
MFSRLLVCVLSSTGVGFFVGTGLGFLVAFASWGLSLGVGMAVGTVTGLLAGSLAVADASGRYGGAGQWIGTGVGILGMAGLLLYAAVYGPGMAPLEVGDLLYLVGAFGFAGGVGFVSGRLGESAGRWFAET